MEILPRLPGPPPSALEKDLPSQANSLDPHLPSMIQIRPPNLKKDLPSAIIKKLALLTKHHQIFLRTPDQANMKKLFLKRLFPSP